MALEDGNAPEYDKAHADAVKAAGATATQIGANYVAEYYFTLVARLIPEDLARELTLEFSRSMVNPAIHKANGQS